MREWLIAIASSLSATFAGLIWWMARKRLTSRFDFQVAQVTKDGFIQTFVTIKNRGDSDIFIERVSVNPPLTILVGANNLPRVLHVTQERRELKAVTYDWRIDPDKSATRELVIVDSDGSSGRRVSVTLHILKSFPMIRHKKKVLTTTLPASMRSATD